MVKKYSTIDLTQGDSPDSPTLGVARDSLNVLTNIDESLTIIKDKILNSSDSDKNEDRGISVLYNRIKDMFSEKGKSESLPSINKELQSGGQSVGLEKQVSSLSKTTTTSTQPPGPSGQVTGNTPKMAEGGSINDKAFWVGDGTGDKKAAELVINPTEAPVQILNQDQRQQAGIEDPEVFHGGKQSGAIDETSLTDLSNFLKGAQNTNKFADGTVGQEANLDSLSKILKNPTGYGVNLSQDSSGQDGIRRYADGTVQDSFKNLAQYATGAAIANDALGPALSGGKGVDPVSAVAAPLDTISGVTQYVGDAVAPGLGTIISAVIDSFQQLVTGIIKAVQSVNSFAEGIAYVSGQVQTAKGGLEAKQIEADIGLNDRYGERLAKIYETSGEIWIETQKTLASIATPFIDLLVPILQFVNEIMPKITAFVNHQDEVAGVTGTVLAGILALGGPLGFLTAGIRLYNHWYDEKNNSTIEKEIQLDMFRTLREAMGPPINKETTSPTVGI